MGLLARREHAVAELQQKLLNKGYGLSEVEPVLQQLQQQGLLSDQRFAEAYVQYRVQRGDGPLKLQQVLRQRGVAAAVYRPQLEQVDWPAVLRQHWQRRFAVPAETYREWTRQARHLQSKGFSTEQIRRFMPALAASETEDCQSDPYSQSDPL